MTYVVVISEKCLISYQKHLAQTSVATFPRLVTGRVGIFQSLSISVSRAWSHFAVRSKLVVILTSPAAAFGNCKAGPRSNSEISEETV
ncbi:hypothetical protein Pla100_30030 [Neorhodopirellula pilleata]|uniref:Uncharacterized protein n=1 Tax=Neorhodopirellula pilleata TaxID=2714738 RepID=A0A5C6AAU2_9BACT|nr:hypothetical protein Pla100_30030 [Neorhodopirellula pilleata]